MSTNFSYSGDPQSASRLDIVRLMIGDTDKTDPLLTDSEIEIALAASSVNTYAAAACADFIAAKFARHVTVKIGTTSVSGAEKAKAYRELAKSLRSNGAGDIPGGDGTGAPIVTMFAGGRSRQRRDAMHDDPDLIEENFSIGQHDFPRGRGDGDDDKWRR